MEEELKDVLSALSESELRCVNVESELTATRELVLSMINQIRFNARTGDVWDRVFDVQTMKAVEKIGMGENLTEGSWYAADKKGQ